MTTKERKKLKHSLKTDIDNADLYIRMALAGVELGANEDKSTLDSRAYITSQLEKLRDRIILGASDFEAEITRAMRAMDNN